MLEIKREVISLGGRYSHWKGGVWDAGNDLLPDFAHTWVCIMWSITKLNSQVWLPVCVRVGCLKSISVLF